MASNYQDELDHSPNYDSNQDSDSEENRGDDLIDRMMGSRKYGQYLKSLMAEVVEEKLGPRLDYIESEIQIENKWFHIIQFCPQLNQLNVGYLRDLF